MKHEKLVFLLLTLLFTWTGLKILPLLSSRQISTENHGDFLIAAFPSSSKFELISLKKQLSSPTLNILPKKSKDCLSTEAPYEVKCYETSHASKSGTTVQIMHKTDDSTIWYNYSIENGKITPISLRKSSFDHLFVALGIALVLASMTTLIIRLFKHHNQRSPMTPPR